MARQLEVDFEFPRYMVVESNEIIRRDFPSWLVQHMDKPNATVAVRAIWAGWLFLKFQEEYAAGHDGDFVGVTYESYSAIDDPFVFESTMLVSQYKDSMERMARLYPDVYYSKGRDNNYFLARLGWACLRELHDQTLLLNYDTKLAEKMASGDEIAELGYAWLSENPKRPIKLEKRKSQVING